MSTCARCKEAKSSDRFYTNGTKGIARWCKTCRCADERRRRGDARLVAQFHDRYETDMEFRARELLRAVQKRCRKNSIPFDLDVPWMAERLRGKCELTGLDFDLSVRTRRPKVYTPSIDRIQPVGGYTKANCRLVVFGINQWMKNFTLDAILPIADALLRHSRKSPAA